MNYKTHMTVFAVIAVLGLTLFWFMPQFGAAIFLPAMGAYFGARKAKSNGPAQPSYVLWGVFFVFAAIAVAIRFLVPEVNFGGFDQWPESMTLLIAYSGTLGAAYLMFGYLAYLQRVGRANS
jgi:glucan phosphoethanolaminetransferase (alkaline phosphatase superfamily)